MTIIPDLADLFLQQVDVAETVTLTLRSTARTAYCPVCGAASTRVHSRYLRTLRDLPTSGRPVRLVLEVRRFVCGERTGVRKIFADLQW